MKNGKQHISQLFRKWSGKMYK